MMPDIISKACFVILKIHLVRKTRLSKFSTAKLQYGLHLYLWRLKCLRNYKGTLIVVRKDNCVVYRELGVYIGHEMGLSDLHTFSPRLSYFTQFSRNLDFGLKTSIDYLTFIRQLEVEIRREYRYFEWKEYWLWFPHIRIKCVSL